MTNGDTAIIAGSNRFTVLLPSAFAYTDMRFELYTSTSNGFTFPPTPDQVGTYKGIKSFSVSGGEVSVAYWEDGQSELIIDPFNTEIRVAITRGTDFRELNPTSLRFESNVPLSQEDLDSVVEAELKKTLR